VTEHSAEPSGGPSAERPADRTECPHVVLAAGSTATARIEGLSAAGADPSLVDHTPAADAELLAFGTTVRAPAVPVAPTGCPTPALATRAVREVVGFDATVLDAGLAARTGAPTVDVGASPGDDVRQSVAVPDVPSIAEAARAWAESLPADRIAVAETIPGGTTTAMAVLRALGERPAVSSSLPENPIDRKRAVVEAALGASDLATGDCAGRPIEAVLAVGDPVQATLLGVLRGAREAGTAVELWGGTQQLAVAALARHDGDAGPLRVATTRFVAEDDSAAVRALAADLDVDLVATDPGFAGTGHVAMERFAAGEAKEGVGMGGALALASTHDILPAVRERFVELYEGLVPDGSASALPSDASTSGRDGSAVDRSADGSTGGEDRGS